jgi:hypothetical protein
VKQSVSLMPYPPKWEQQERERERERERDYITIARP